MNRDIREIITLKVMDMCGPHCVGVEDGKFIFKKMLPILQSGTRVCLDFTDVLTVTSSFLNASIGKLLGRFKEMDIDKQVRWKGLDENDVQLVKLVIRNAKEHFAKSEKTREVENKIVRHVLEEQ